MIGKNLIYVCNFAANYSGNFIASISKLAENVMKNNQVFFLFPEGARNKKWLSKLPVPNSHLLFCTFGSEELNVICQKLSKDFSTKNTVVHTHFVDGEILSSVTSNFKNVVVHYHMTVPEVFGPRSFFQKVKLNLIYKKVVVVGVSKAVTLDLKKYFPFCKHECITNAISFEDLEHNVKLFNPSISIDQDSFSILIHGTDFYGKGVDLAIKALDNIDPNMSSKCMLYITSHHTESAHKLVSTLKSSFANVRVLDVTEGVKKLYDSVDLFISPSRKEAFGYSVAEASYSECQVLASDVPGQNTMMDIPGIYWVDLKDSESLKKAIAEAFIKKETNKIGEIKEEQKEYVFKNYNIDKWVDANIKLYDTYFERTERTNKPMFYITSLKKMLGLLK